MRSTGIKKAIHQIDTMERAIRNMCSQIELETEHEIQRDIHFEHKSAE